MAGALTDLVERTGLFRVPLRDRRCGARAGLPRSAWGTAVAHFGIAVSMLGIICAGTWGTERIVAVKPAQTVSLSGYDLTFDGLAQRAGPELSARWWRHSPCASGGAAGRRDGAVEAQLRRARHDRPTRRR